MIRELVDAGAIAFATLSLEAPGTDSGAQSAADARKSVSLIIKRSAGAMIAEN